jgi:rod shape-determining protein MreC
VNPSNWASTFTISKGSDSGIELGDCVVTEYEALVGQIIELGDTWATVRTVIDVDMDVGALVGRTAAPL